MPGAVKLLPIPKPSAGVYDFDDYERWWTGQVDPNAI